MDVINRLDPPSGMRAFAESVEQARKTLDGFMSAAHHGVCAFEGQADSTRKSAKDVTEKVMTFAEQNFASSFEFVQQLVRTTEVQDALRLQADYIRRQMQVFTEQARELVEVTSKVVKDGAAPKR
jgi:phasin